MVQRGRFVPASRWLLPILAFLLVLGHVCELPAFGAERVLTAYVTEDVDHQAHGHAHDAGISCDPIDVVASIGSGTVGPTLDAAPPVVMLPDSKVAVPRITASLDHSTRLAGRPPLFLLHSALLI